MIIDALPNQYEILAYENALKAWQRGLLVDMLSEKHWTDDILCVNMGRGAGHTYFSRMIASSKFPVRTKVYVSRKEVLSEYSDLLFNPNKVHFPIDILNDRTVNGCQGEFVIIDMAGEQVRRFKKKIQLIRNILSVTKVLLLQAEFLT